MKTLLAILFLLWSTLAFAQVGINTDATNPDISAMLDVKSTTKGILVPRMTQTQRNTIVTPATGLMIYQTDGIAGFYYNSGTPASPLWLLVGGSLNLPYSGTVTSDFPAIQVTNNGLGEGVKGISTGNGVYGLATNSTGITYGVYGETSSSSGMGVKGFASSSSGTTNGVFGEATSSSGSGVKGWASSLSGTTYGVYGESYSSSGYGVMGYAGNSSGANYGVFGRSYSASGYGVFGEANNSPGTNYGVYGRSFSSNGTGVKGIVTNTSGITYGLYGETASSSGYGVYGTANSSSGVNYGLYGESASTTGYGVCGKTTTSSGINYGLYGESASSTGYGVYGKNTSSSGINYGIFGQSASSSGYGVYGRNISSSGNNYGVYGESWSSSGKGVYGEASLVSGTNYGVYGRSNSSDGYGVYGLANYLSGTNFGVYGQTNSSSGYSGYFTGGSFYIDGNVGIGTTSPACILHVHNPTTGSVELARFSNPSGQRLVQLRQGSSGAGAFYLYDATEASTIFLYAGGNSYINGGNLGIGTSSPDLKLDVLGNGRFSAIGSGTYYAAVNETSDGTLTTATSDVRFKENIRTLQDCLDKVLQLRGVSFTWKTNPEYGTRIGFIAQEFEKVIPELVFTNKVDGYKGINYAEVSAILVEAIKELKTENDYLKAENEKINTRLDKLETLMSLRVEK